MTDTSDPIKTTHPLAEMTTMFFRNYAAVAGLMTRVSEALPV